MPRDDTERHRTTQNDTERHRTTQGRCWTTTSPPRPLASLPRLSLPHSSPRASALASIRGSLPGGPGDRWDHGQNPSPSHEKPRSDNVGATRILTAGAVTSSRSRNAQDDLHAPGESCAPHLQPQKLLNDAYIVNACGLTRMLFADLPGACCFSRTRRSLLLAASLACRPLSSPVVPAVVPS